MSSYTRQQLEAWLKKIEVIGGAVLDVGGSQNPVNHRLKTFKPFDYQILDLSSPHENKRQPDIDCDLNLGFHEKDDYKFEGYFDTVFCLEVLEYIFNPIRALQIIGYFMKKGGALYLSTGFIYPVHEPISQDYLRYTQNGILKLLDSAGFIVKECLPRVELPNAMSFKMYAKTQGMRPAQGYRGHNQVGNLIKAIKT